MLTSWKTIQPCSHPPALFHWRLSADLQTTARPLRLMASLRARCKLARKVFVMEDAFCALSMALMDGAMIASRTAATEVVTSSSTSVKALARCGVVERVKYAVCVPMVDAMVRLKVVQVILQKR